MISAVKGTPQEVYLLYQVQQACQANNLHCCCFHEPEELLHAVP